jgi:chromosome partitioning protein
VVITLCNGKGGSGKTSAAILLASALAEAGHDVAVLDTDPQGTATRWLTATGQEHLIANATKRHSVLIIDTPPRLDKRVSDAVRRADLIILVTSPSPADLFASQDTVEMLERAGVKGKARILFNQVQTGTILARDLADMAVRVGLPALESKLQRRQAYQHAVLTGWKGLPWDAREEALAVAVEIISVAK